MNIQSTIRKNPSLQAALAEGTLETPSVILRTPAGSHDLLLTKQAYSEPSLRKLLIPIKNLVAEALAQMAPGKAEMLNGVSAIIDVTVQLAADVHQSQAATLQPKDGTQQLSKILESADGDTDDPIDHQERMQQIFGSQRKPGGLISFLASFNDDSAAEKSSPIELVLGSAPLMGDLFQIGEGVFQLLDAPQASSSLAKPSLDPQLMEELRARLAKPGDDACTKKL